MKLTIMCGLPSSGKTTKAQTMGGRTVLSPDDVRLALHGERYIANAEGFVWATVETAARALLLSRNDVVIDATNNTAARRARWKKIASEFGITLGVMYMMTPFDECMERIGDDDVMADVLKRMYQEFEPPNAEEEGCLVFER